MEIADPKYWTKVGGRVARAGARFLCRRPFTIKTPIPIISFTFDDFPRSALLEGDRILSRFGVRATYYVSLGLLGKQAPPGAMFLFEDLKRLLEKGHELGCHTFGHCHSWNTAPAAFERSVLENQRALAEILPQTSFRTLAYPISAPRPGTKKRMSKHFECCRGGYMDMNAGTADLNSLQAYFLEKSRGNPNAVKDMIDRNRRERGWLIFATHDISDSPSPFGCRPDVFDQVVRWSVDSGARILPVIDALRTLQRNASH